MNKLMKINEADNVLVVRSSIVPGDEVHIKNSKIIFDKALGLGHKIAERTILKGEKIIKFGVPIGSAVEDISIGSHVHLHNMKSDYISTYTLDHEFISTK
ncbi:MAG: UxaA family hydrolase [Chitinophagaceae bacterium]